MERGNPSKSRMEEFYSDRNLLLDCEGTVKVECSCMFLLVGLAIAGACPWP